MANAHSTPYGGREAVAPRTSKNPLSNSIGTASRIPVPPVEVRTTRANQPIEEPPHLSSKYKNVIIHDPYVGIAPNPIHCHTSKHDAPVATDAGYDGEGETSRQTPMGQSNAPSPLHPPSKHGEPYSHLDLSGSMIVHPPSQPGSLIIGPHRTAHRGGHGHGRGGGQGRGRAPPALSPPGSSHNDSELSRRADKPHQWDEWGNRVPPPHHSRSSDMRSPRDRGLTPLPSNGGGNSWSSGHLNRREVPHANRGNPPSGGSGSNGSGGRGPPSGAGDLRRGGGPPSGGGGGSPHGGGGGPPGGGGGGPPPGGDPPPNEDESTNGDEEAGEPAEGNDPQTTAPRVTQLRFEEGSTSSISRHTRVNQMSHAHSAPHYSYLNRTTVVTQAADYKAESLQRVQVMIQE
ncbi:hypothetical protein JAAARDRAFT_198564 [Jaapia argillacea MUCL 33604]|uniref:Uncharacterized protein n=1 Tax=Jaapia argillacea MUCL 33604 TaxID=933084 RepID=A0A067PB47_9AGAM|nr:hypothetical protein JAAARDRAFT_198564 [Jaapia argillacea MUCL 33604]